MDNFKAPSLDLSKLNRGISISEFDRKVDGLKNDNKKLAENVLLLKGIVDELTLKNNEMEKSINMLKKKVGDGRMAKSMNFGKSEDGKE